MVVGDPEKVRSCRSNSEFGLGGRSPAKEAGASPSATIVIVTTDSGTVKGANLALRWNLGKVKVKSAGVTTTEKSEIAQILFV